MYVYDILYFNQIYYKKWKMKINKQSKNESVLIVILSETRAFEHTFDLFK